MISDEAHRTEAGQLAARNMRLALPNAAFIGFTGTPLVKQDELTRRIFGDYVSPYDFKRSEEDGATVTLVYEQKPGHTSFFPARLGTRRQPPSSAPSVKIFQDFSKTAHHSASTRPISRIPDTPKTGRAGAAASD